MPFGHPGFSAYEYAGVMDRHKHEERAWKMATEQTYIEHADQQQTAPKIASEQKSNEIQVTDKVSELQQPQKMVDESAIAHRRRGTFMNHTPRNHEPRLSTKFSQRPTSSNDPEHLHTAYRKSSEDNFNTERYCSVHQLSYDSSAAGRRTRVNSNAAIDNGVEVHLNPLIMHPLPIVPAPTLLPRQRRSQSLSATSSTKSSRTGLTKRSLRSLLNRNVSFDANLHQSASFEDLVPDISASVSKLRPEIANSKRRRRQTPYNIPKPLLTELGRHAPLEPLVLHHRREVTGSNVDPLPPHIDIDNDIGEAATFLAINEYFDSQESTIVSPKAMELVSSEKSSPDEKSVGQAERGSSPTDCHEGKDADITRVIRKPTELSPSVPKRNPERLSRVNTPSVVTPRRIMSASELSVQSDFTSAATGTYSPYDQHYNTVTKTSRQVPASPPKGFPAQVQECSVSAPARLAPPIPGHDELANARLNDFNYFLRMTGPSPTNETQDTLKKKKKGFSVTKAYGKKHAKTSTARGSSPPASPPAYLPSCAQQMTTSAGTKHLEIKVPTAQDIAPGVPYRHMVISRTSCDRSLTWTEEMLHPLGSAPVERIIQASDIPSTPVPKSPLRSPKPAAKSPKTVPVEDHPLAVSREEATRIRKLRDLKKVRERGVGIVGGRDVMGVDEEVKRLERLVVQLAGALACEMGVETRDLIGAEKVLGIWKERKKECEFAAQVLGDGTEGAML